MKKNFFMHPKSHWIFWYRSGPHPDPLVRGTDPRIRIRTRIRTKILRIRSTAFCFEVKNRKLVTFLIGSNHGKISNHVNRKCSIRKIAIQNRYTKYQCRESIFKFLKPSAKDMARRLGAFPPGLSSEADGGLSRWTSWEVRTPSSGSAGDVRLLAAETDRLQMLAVPWEPTGPVC